MLQPILAVLLAACTFLAIPYKAPEPLPVVEAVYEAVPVPLIPVVSGPLPDIPRPSLVAKAERYVGKTASQIGVRRTLWCSAFLRFITGATGVNDLAKSWLVKRHVPRPAAGEKATLASASAH